jgi:MarR family transcriptional regulator, temperature-dependent positive regulator of motility
MARPLTSEAGRMLALRDHQESFPGHLMRRAQQVLTLAWAEEVSTAVTSSQFVILNVLRAAPGIDQRTLGELVSMDRSTVAAIVARLTAIGLIRHSRHPLDKRRKVLATTAKGSKLAADLAPRAEAMSGRLMALLGDDARQARFMSELRSLVHSWEDAHGAAVNGEETGAGPAALEPDASASALPGCISAVRPPRSPLRRRDRRIAGRWC